MRATPAATIYMDDRSWYMDDRSWLRFCCGDGYTEGATRAIFTNWGLSRLPDVKRLPIAIQPGWIGVVDGIVHGKGVRVGGGACARDEERIAG